MYGFSIADLLDDITYSFNYDTNNENFLILENDPVLDKWTKEKFDNKVIPSNWKLENNWTYSSLVYERGWPKNKHDYKI